MPLKNGKPTIQDVYVGGRFQILERLGGGAFGDVFKGKDINSERLVAMKVELSKDGHRSHLNLEYRIYKALNECPITVGIPRAYYCGRVGDYTVMVMDLLGPSLEELFNYCHRYFNPKTVCMIGVQIIQRLEYMHSVGYLHRDIKPENFVMGLSRASHVVYVIDVGLAKAWRDSSGRHIPYAEGKALTGTARYVSINTHKGLQQSRRDDLESVSYLLAYLLRGTLPWQGLKTPKGDTRYARICEVKAASTPESLAWGYPRQFGQLIHYARNLSFEETPDYTFCMNLLLSALLEAGVPFDYRYAWNVATSDYDTVSQQPSDTSCHSRQRTAAATGGTSVLQSSMFLPDGEYSQVNSAFFNNKNDTYGNF